MKLSWSHKLFFKINNLIGKNMFLDRVSYFCAHWLIFILGGLVLGWGAFVLVETNPAGFVHMIKLLITYLAVAELISYSIALIWKHPRPRVEFPEIKNLLTTTETWKSFPSDHTIIAFGLAYATVISGASLLFGSIVFILAVCVAFGRVFVGVHYPRDIVGGFIIASLVVYVSPWLLEYVSQPIYDALKIFF